MFSPGSVAWWIVVLVGGFVCGWMVGNLGVSSAVRGMGRRLRDSGISFGRRVRGVLVALDNHSDESTGVV